MWHKRIFSSMGAETQLMLPKAMQETHAYLEHERSVWMPLKERDIRTLGKDAMLHIQLQESAKRLDGHLEVYFAQLALSEAFSETTA